MESKGEVKFWRVVQPARTAESKTRRRSVSQKPKRREAPEEHGARWAIPEINLTVGVAPVVLGALQPIPKVFLVEEMPSILMYPVF
ncbi:hypothetical protein CC1G_15164 [Coprinopsis cinerea okayama7|uniref:Uncharacterized protein n=1 Tax=Coprinopsis cinerea (strain Okayama-7 / 130 / ATCC MYA-4618 / FGSC 9003) TaxID=240176 RepID=D6RPT1_COPC7|nr:hypothetical protein CC1G_15164 [Coprinopsis cinerea okayama7\|eukprot:XP_002910525.1 hypothetical protein CC1G_15164 [Coprinopsis cinerea okayama7\